MTVNRTFLTVMLLFNIFSLQFTAVFPLLYKLPATRNIKFLHAAAATAVARFGHRNSVLLSVRLSLTQVDQSKTVQARITKFSPSAAWKTQVSESVKLFDKFERGYPQLG